VERLLKKFKDEKDTTHLLNIVNRNSQRLLMLIRQLLEIRKLESGHQTLQVELTQAKPFIMEIFTSFEELAEKNDITFTNDIKINKPIWIDKVKLENVLYNLLSNAFKFTSSQDEIVLEAKILNKENLDILRICVSDTGVGIPSDQLDKLFNRFVQLTRSRKHKRAGTGIGLSMVKGLVELMYGTITVASDVGKGSVFTIEIPVSRIAFDVHEIDTTGQVYESTIRDRVAMLDDQLSTSAHYEYSKDEDTLETILVVEDNDDMRSYIASNLAQFYRVIEADNGAEGYELAKKEIPSIILSDVMMPEMNGTELCRKIKNNLYTSHIPLILLTAKSKEEDQVAGLEIGADDYIIKPFNIEILVAKIRTLIQNRNKVMDKFSRLEDVSPDEMKISELDGRFYKKADEIVCKYYSEASFDVDQFASEMLVSRSQLYSKLKAITNLSANEFINTYRLKKSIELLRQGNLNISEVAYATGFNDPKYFSRIFKKYYHKSPSEILKK
jgi:DNA-binding response OmpR family regulator/two-component sensor histidine kinase